VTRFGPPEGFLGIGPPKVEHRTVRGLVAADN
jgi:hypothetical protein